MPCFFRLPEVFRCRKNWETNEKKRIFRRQWIQFSNFVGPSWLKSVGMSSDRWNSKNWLFWFFAKTFWFFSGWVLAKYFLCFFAVFLTHLQETSYLIDYTYEHSKHIGTLLGVLKCKCMLNLFFNKKCRNFLAAENLTKKIEEVFFQKTSVTFFLFSRSCWIPRLLLLPNRWNINN